MINKHIDPTLTGELNLVRLINENNPGVNIASDDVLLSIPEAFEGANGRNARVEIAAKKTAPFTGRTTVHYRRLGIDECLVPNAVVKGDMHTTLEELHLRVCAAHGINPFSTTLIGDLPVKGNIMPGDAFEIGIAPTTDGEYVYKPDLTILHLFWDGQMLDELITTVDLAGFATYSEWYIDPAYVNIVRFTDPMIPAATETEYAKYIDDIPSSRGWINWGGVGNQINGKYVATAQGNSLKYAGGYLWYNRLKKLFTIDTVVTLREYSDKPAVLVKYIATPTNGGDRALSRAADGTMKLDCGHGLVTTWSNSRLTLGVRAHIRIACDGSTTRVFINGHLEAEVDVSIGLTNSAYVWFYALGPVIMYEDMVGEAEWFRVVAACLSTSDFVPNFNEPSRSAV